MLTVALVFDGRLPHSPADAVPVVSIEAILVNIYLLQLSKSLPSETSRFSSGAAFQKKASSFA